MEFIFGVRSVAMMGFLVSGIVSAGTFPAAVTPGSADIKRSSFPQELKLEYSFRSDVDFDDESGGFDIQGVRFKTPVTGHRGSGFSWSLDFEAEYTNFNSRDQPLVGDHDLYEVGVRALFAWRNVGGSNWSPVVVLDPSIATDFDSISSDAFRLTAFAGAFYEQQRNLRWLVGVIYNDLGFEENLFPAVGFSWQPNDFLDLTLLGPRFDIKYKYSDDWRLGLFADIYSRSWDVRNGGEQQTLSVFSVRAGAKVDYQVVDGTWVYTEFGVTLANSVEVNDENDSELFDEDADTGLFFNVGLRVEF